MTSRFASILPALLLCILLAMQSAAFADDGKSVFDLAKPIRIDFNSEKVYDSFSKYPADWDYKGTWGVPDAKLFVIKDEELGTNILKLISDKESGTVMYYKLIGKIDLNKTPIFRWKWKVSKLPPGGDARDANKDDQAIGLYAGYGRIFRKSVSYRWETETPIGTEGDVNYTKVVKVRWHCIRNKNSPMDKWIVEERNLAEDFKKDFGEVPSDIILIVSINSEYTASSAEAYLEYMEFLPLNAAKASAQ